MRNEFRFWSGTLAALTAALPAPAAPAKKPAAKKPSPATAAAAPKPGVPAGIVRLDITPASGALDGPRARQQLVVSAATPDGSSWDVTHAVTFTSSNPKILKVTGGVALPVGDGKAQVVARLGKISSPAAELTVANAGTAAVTEFVNDIMPVLSKAGCNNTACHGSPAGKGGFKLSLFGYEPELDHPALVKDSAGKRVDLKSPEKSLVLQKATGQVAHGGGPRIKAGSPEYRVFLAWLKEGAPGVGEFEARVKEIRAAPDQPWLPKPGSHQRLLVTAYLSDGSSRDVTDKAIFTSNDDAIAEVDEQGIVTAKRSGETAVMVRYLGQVGVARVAVLPAVKPPASAARVRPNNYVDEAVLAKLDKLRMLPSDLCTDEEFIRRASLDVCGLIPSVDEVRTFLADTSPNKREKLVDRLLARPEFVDVWTMKWNDTLRNNPQAARIGTGAYAKWIRQQVASNRPYDEFVRDLLTATGRTTTLQLDMANLPPQLQRRPAQAQQLVQLVNSTPPNPAANYFVVSRDPLDTTSATSQIFLGVRIECARCHNHPFEKWTQSDYYSLATYFTGVRAVGGNQAPNVVMPTPRPGTLRHPRTNEVVEPRTLDGADFELARSEDRRAKIAQWITSPENPWFSKAIVNRIWAHYFGRGIVEPVDDFRVTNPAANPALLDALAKDLVAHKFDLKKVHRAILTSRTYQQSSRPNQYNKTDTSNFARYYPKRMAAEELYDSISQATGIFLNAAVAPGRRGRPAPGIGALIGGGNNLQAQALRDALPDGPVERVMQLPIVPRGGRGGDLFQFLDTFGKPRREVVCECERSDDGNMGQALALVNGNEVNDKIAAPIGRVQQLVRSTLPEAKVVEELYLATLSRRPTLQEATEAANLIRSSRSRAEGIEDLTWSLLNSREFLFNH